MEFIKQNKGKMLSKVASSKLIESGWALSTKYDGNYVQIHFDPYNPDNSVVFTSSGKPMRFSNLQFLLESYLGYIKEPTIIEAEYIYDCEGKLGDRTKSARLTTYRTNSAKGLSNDLTDKDIFMVFDVIKLDDTKFSDRLKLLNSFKSNNNLKTIDFSFEYSINEALDIALAKNLEGYEGLMLKQMNHIYKPGKRTNDVIKIKELRRIDLKCYDIVPGRGKYSGMIGGLHLINERTGMTCQVGSGLNDSMRSKDSSYFLGKTIQIKYEQILDTYVQPVFIKVV